MCFYIDSKYPNKQIAKRDITCYKVLWNDYKSAFHFKLYKLNKLYKVRIEKPYFWHDTYLIDQGFHSYSSLKQAIKERVYNVKLVNYCSYSNRFTLQKFVIVKCMIPKDSEYYYNSERREYVSNQIVIKERIK